MIVVAETKRVVTLELERSEVHKLLVGGEIRGKAQMRHNSTDIPIDIVVYCSDPVTDGWISVAEKLPEEGVLVLTYDSDDSSYGVDHLIDCPETEIEKPYVWGWRLVGDWEKVTHWMPLPKEPNER